MRDVSHLGVVEYHQKMELAIPSDFGLRMTYTGLCLFVEICFACALLFGCSALPEMGRRSSVSVAVKTCASKDSETVQSSDVSAAEVGLG